MTEKTEKSLCVTCGEYRTTEKFKEGDCTCLDCHEAGRSGVNYRTDETYGVVPTDGANYPADSKQE